MDRNLKSTEKQATSTSKATVALSGAIAGIASAATIRQIGQYADTYTGLQNRLKLVTDSAEELASTNERLLSIAQNTRNSLEGTVDLYSRLARSTDSLGISNDRLFAVTESVNQAIAVSGTTAASAEAALFQLGQGLSAGALRGEELNSVLEQTPRLAQAIADGLGVSIAQLRELGSEGQLTAERVIQALENQSSVLAREYSNTSSTISQAFQKINNELITYIGNADKSTGATESLVSALNGVSDNFAEIADTTTSVLVPAITTLALLYGSRLAGGIAAATTARISDTAAIVKQTVAERSLLKAEVDSLAIKVRQAQAEVQQTRNRLANATAIARQSGNLTVLSQAQTAAASAQQRLIGLTTAQTAAITRYTVATSAATVATRGLSSAMAFLGGPVGVAITAAGALGIYAANIDEAKVKSQEAIGPIDQLALSLRELFRVLSGTQEDALVESLASGFAKNTEEDIERLISNTESKLEEFRRKNADKGFFGKSFDQDIEGAERQLKALEIALSRVAKGTDDTNDTEGELSSTTKDIVDTYSNYKEKLDQVFAINQKYDSLIKDIKKNVSDAAHATELISLAEKNRSRDLDLLNKKIDRQNKSIKDQKESYSDLLSEFDPLTKVAKDYESTIERIDQSTATASEKTKLYAEAQKALAENVAKANEEIEEQANEKLPPLQRAFKDYAEDAIDATDEIQAAGENAAKNLEDAFVQFAETGKLSFKDLVTSILADIARIQVRQNITGPLSGAISGFDFGSLFSGSSGSSTGFDLSGLDFFAKGGVINSPTVLGTSSSGNVAVGGEAGPEAVLPLSRTSSGDLGVMSIGGNQPITIEIINKSSGEVQSNVQETIGANGDRQIRAIIQDSVKEGLGAGAFDRQLKTNFGVNRRGV